MKSYTDLEQSKVLSDILPIESADECYIKHSSSNNPFWEFNDDFPPMILGNVPINEMTVETLPCWSLTALLNILPYPQLSKDKLGGGKEGWMVSTYPNNCRYDSTWHDNQIDACYEMIIKLHEENIL